MQIWRPRDLTKSMIREGARNPLQSLTGGQKRDRVSTVEPGYCRVEEGKDGRPSLDHTPALHSLILIPVIHRLTDIPTLHRLSLIRLKDIPDHNDQLTDRSVYHPKNHDMYI